MTRSEFIREKVRQHLEHANEDACIPGLGRGRRGKVRHIYSATDAQGENIVVLSTSDRVSAFDVVLDRPIPHKGAVLNAIAVWWFEKTEDIIPNALLSSPSRHIMVQKELTNIGFECIVRGYLWGSLATAYEGGMREKCGAALEEGLWRYQKLKAAVFTPTTKAHRGHDQDVTLEEMAAALKHAMVHKGWAQDGEEMAQKVRDISLRLYRRGDELAQKAGLILVDTKYEFGLDVSGKMYLMDEVHTPDSSRYVERADWMRKWPLVKSQMQTGQWVSVTQLLGHLPELKIKELSKQLIRDVLMERGYDPASGDEATLSDADVIETSARYIELYERLTGEPFDFRDERLTWPDGFEASSGSMSPP